MRIINMLLSLLYPNNCAFCKKNVSYSRTETYICSECMEKLNFCIRNRRCSLCGSPIDNTAHNLCAECYTAKKNRIPVYYDKITAPVVYDNNVKDAVVYLKKGRFLGAVTTFCHLIEAMLKSDFAGVNFDFIVSVPPRQQRMRETNFDQSKIIAENLAKIIKVKYLRGSMKRLRETEKQSGLGLFERKTNLDGAFALKRPAEIFKNKTILVIDDVSTTGSTINECARVLKQAGAVKVYGAVIAKTSKC